MERSFTPPRRGISAARGPTSVAWTGPSSHTSSYTYYRSDLALKLALRATRFSIADKTRRRAERCVVQLHLGSNRSATDRIYHFMYLPSIRITDWNGWSHYTEIVNQVEHFLFQLCCVRNTVRVGIAKKNDAKENRIQKREKAKVIEDS